MKTFFCRFSQIRLEELHVTNFYTIPQKRRYQVRILFNSLSSTVYSVNILMAKFRDSFFLLYPCRQEASCLSPNMVVINSTPDGGFHWAGCVLLSSVIYDFMRYLWSIIIQKTFYSEKTKWYLTFLIQITLKIWNMSSA